MSRKIKVATPSAKANTQPGQLAKASGVSLRSYEVGALPIINRILERMRLERLLRQLLPPDDSRTKLSTQRVLLVLLRNILISREPIYGLGQWARRYAPDLLDLFHDEVELLNDDRAGHALDTLFSGLEADLIMPIVRQVISEFRLSLDELHNDSTTVSFYGAYNEAEQEGRALGRPTLAITFGHSKDHRPDLKQLLYILTITDDGGVPIYFTSANGNTTDDTTHRDTWDLLHQLVGRADFLYVADCKLASSENMNYIARQDGRFITVLPRSRKEDQQFRQRLLKKPDSVDWTELYRVTKDIRTKGKVIKKTVDRLTVCSQEMLSKEGYRLLWYHSTKKAESDAHGRASRLQRATRKLTELRDRLQGPRTRFGERDKVEQAVQEILTRYMVDSLISVDIQEQQKASYRQARRGRPNKKTKYVKEVKTRFDITWTLDAVRIAEEEACDGIFPLISNQTEMTAEEILRAYKRQPIIEKRFSQFKTDFSVGPVYLKSVHRIQALLAVYFLVLVVQTLLERELRQAMERAGVESLPLYPEGRACRRPTARKLIDLFDGVQRHELTLPGQETEVIVTELSPVQKQVLQLLGISPKNYGK
jgi:transposase